MSDEDLQEMDRADFIAEVQRLRIRGCVHYRQSLDEHAPNAPVFDHEYGGEDR